MSARSCVSMSEVYWVLWKARRYSGIIAVPRAGIGRAGACILHTW